MYVHEKDRGTVEQVSTFVCTCVGGGGGGGRGEVLCTYVRTCFSHYTQ